MARTICSSKSSERDAASSCRYRGSTVANPSTSPSYSASTSAGSRRPSRASDNASIHSATGSEFRLRGNSTNLPMMRRTSSSVMVVRLVGCVAKGGEPLTIANAIALRVRTCSPGRSATLRAHLLLSAFVEGDEADRAGR